MNEENHTGIKHDQGKPRFALMPPLAELEVVKVLSFGADKYSPDNWRKVDPIRYGDAAGRHINAHRRGETADAESRLHALAHAICCLMFQLEKELESEQAPAPRSRDLLPRWRRTRVLGKKQTAATQEPHQTTAGTFSTNDLPLIGQLYRYRTNTGEVHMRFWQSTPQEWKRLAAGQVFKTFEACKDAEHTEAYIFHEDDPVPHPEMGKLLWYVGISPSSLTWMALCIYYPDDWKKGMELANEIHGRGTAAMSEEHAKAKALWRNLSMQRHGTPYGPLHPDAKQSNEPFPGNDEGEEM